jgi:hypothetical protein
MHASRPLLLAFAAALTLPAAAVAQTPLPTPTAAPPTATPSPAPTPAPAPAAAGRLGIKATAPLRSKGKKVALKNDVVDVTGSLQPAVAGQQVLVQLKHGRKTLKTRKVKTGADGTFATKVRLRGTGTLVLRAIHQASPEIKRARGKAVRIQTFAPSLHSGSRGALLRLFQKALDDMKYPSPRNGVYDDATGRAVLTYRKVNGLSRTYTPNAKIIRDVLAGKGAFKVRHPKAGHHVEADISSQFIALVDGDKLVRVYPTSSGAPATPTVQGLYHFYSKTPGTNAKGMVYSNYFIRGYAIHGYHDVPTYNASHGCLRIPIPNAITVYNWIRLGDAIYVEP